MEEFKICPECGKKILTTFTENDKGFKQIEPYNCVSCEWRELLSYKNVFLNIPNHELFGYKIDL